EYACICAGSRSTPLTLSAFAHPKITCFSHIDERSGAFFALGLAMITKKPVILISTSGTATANFFPAIIEAESSNIPLIVITADRPHELRETGTNQTIDQLNLYGNKVRWFKDILPPTIDPPEKTIKYLRHIAHRSYYLAKNINPGPIHLNIPFDKPLEPANNIDSSIHSMGSEYYNIHEEAFLNFDESYYSTSENSSNLLIESISSSQRGIILIGPMFYNMEFINFISTLSNLIGFPIFADATSNLRYNDKLDQASFLISTYENFLPLLDMDNYPDLIIHFGRMPISPNILSFLSNYKGKYIQISEYNKWNDEFYNTTHYICSDYEKILPSLINYFTENPIKHDTKWISKLLDWESSVQKVISNILNDSTNDYCEINIIFDVIKHISRDSKVFVSNSMPIRYLDKFVYSFSKTLEICFNRGVSGIDGILSSAMGVATASNQPVILITGDIAFYHDLTALINISRNNVKILIILINNNGGQIFSKLPIRRFDPPYNEFFITPHEINFKEICNGFKIQHQLVNTKIDLLEELNQFNDNQLTKVLEFKIDNQLTENSSMNLHSSILKQLHPSF
ncbi:MAG: 2-succinyl-5-enolpyruvyl-6-hydroxy-3-cyclohexene-1-carboxylic-acid synthase, partial [Candidatus Heimdallarchaeota archaeon]|nr:2-succinyl-5-enolpyruvyl-6-hydroxy-3-cyclohexene-1-carboxylic-acid synthase [Candidatus Heimdallarchaeota archaeon]